MSILLIGDGDRRHVVSRQKLYSDGTPMIKSSEDLTVYHTMLVQPDDLSEFVNAMFLVDSINWQGGGVSRLILPFVPGARQDRINLTGDILYTAKSVANMINERKFETVQILDPHSPVIEGLIDRVRVYPLEKVYANLWKGYTGVIAPDKGSVARAHIASVTLGKPLYRGGKVRDESTGKLTGFEVEDLPKGGHFIVIDDICDGGGTFAGLGEKIREQNCFADLFVTHGIFSKGAHDLKQIYKNIYTTNSRHIDAHNEIMTFDVIKDMLNG